MNNARRAKINAIREQMDAVRLDLEGLKFEEEDAYEALPASLQEAERGVKSQAAAQALDDATTSLEAAVASLEEAVE